MLTVHRNFKIKVERVERGFQIDNINLLYSTTTAARSVCHMSHVQNFPVSFFTPIKFTCPVKRIRKGLPLPSQPD